MTTQIGIGISTKLDSFAAGKEATRAAFYKLGRRDPDILFVFISTIFNQSEAIKGLRSIVKETPLVGLSSAASITPYGSLRDSVTVCAVSSTSIKFTCGVGNNIGKNARLAGSEAARYTSKVRDRIKHLYIMFSNCLSGNTADVLRGTQEILGTRFPIMGGAATDDLQFQKTYQYLDNNIYTDSVVGFLLSGDMNIGIGNAHGWLPIGMPHKITSARSNIVAEIDKKRAVELYEEYLGKSAEELKMERIGKIGGNYPLGIPVKERTEYLLRTPLDIKESGSLMLNADIPEGEDINLMIGDKNLALEAAKKACSDALRNMKRTDVQFAIVFSDIARLQLLRKDAQKEAEIIKDLLGTGVPFFGCYTCGEFAPIDSKELNTQSYVLNHTISIVVFS